MTGGPVAVRVFPVAAVLQFSENETNHALLLDLFLLEPELSRNYFAEKNILFSVRLQGVRSRTTSRARGPQRRYSDSGRIWKSRSAPIMRA